MYTRKAPGPRPLGEKRSRCTDAKHRDRPLAYLPSELAVGKLHLTDLRRVGQLAPKLGVAA